MTGVPVALLLLVGIGLGPQAMGLLSPAVLSSVDPAVPVALAVLGVLVGLGVDARRRDDRRLIAAASVESVLTAAGVASGLAFAASQLAVPPPVPLWFLAMVAGICASSSLTLPSARLMEPLAPVSRLIELDVLTPIVAGGLVLAFMRAGTILGTGSLTAHAAAVALVLAVAGWLLLAQTSSDTERRVFAVATLLLLGGAADFLSLSALFGGLLAGLFWRVVGGPARESVHRDAVYVQHPLVVLVLLVAGARAEFSSTSLGLAAAYVFLRTVGRLVGGSIVARVAPAGLPFPRNLGQRLIAPGVFGVAFALNAVRAVGPDVSPVLAIAVAGTIGCAMLAKLTERPEASV